MNIKASYPRSGTSMNASLVLPTPQNIGIKALCQLASEGLRQQDNKRLAIAVIASFFIHLLLTFGFIVQAPRSHSISGAPLGARIISSTPSSITNRHDIAIEAAIISVNHVNDIKAANDNPVSMATTTAASSTSPLNNVPESTNHQAALTMQDSSKKPAIRLPKDQMYYPALQLDVRPRSLTPITPEFPSNVAANLSGRVVLLVLINENGNVDDASVVEAEPSGYFEASALMAIRNTRFDPGKRFGESVKSRVLIAVDFDGFANDKRNNLP